MAYYIKIFIFSLFFINTAAADWIKQDADTEYNLTAVQFINESTGWACGLDNVVFTTNGGAVWNPVAVSGTHNSIYFINESTGYLVSREGKIKRSIDGGQNWYNITSGVTNDLLNINFSSELTGFITGTQGTILKTTNGGTSWIPINAPAGNIDFYSSYIIDQKLFVIGSEGSIYQSTNSGAGWIDNSLEQPNPFFTIYFTNQATGWVAGCCGMYFKTIDGGSTWSPELYLTQGYTINASDFISSEKGWMAANAGIILKTSTGGDTWFSLPTGIVEDLRAIDFVNENTGWAVGNSGVILKTTNGGGHGVVIGIENVSAEIPAVFSLSQNYPNPFNPATTIVFDIPKAENVTLSIYSMTGKEVDRFSYGNLKAGSYKINYNGSRLPSGVYFYKINTAGFSSIKKMVLLK